MGQRMPDEPIDYGNNCNVCFASGETPEYVYARFSLIDICTGVGFGTCHHPPNDRTFKLTQVVGTPCSWRYQSALWNVYYQQWRISDGKGGLKIEDDLSRGVFEETVNACPPEGLVFHNTLGCVAGTTCGTGGIGVVTWTPQATDILESINLEKATDLFMELRPLANDKLVYKFCKLQDATNIAILFEP